MEAVADQIEIGDDLSLLVEAARSALGRSICSALVSPSGELEVITLEPGVERTIEALRAASSDLPVDPEAPRRLLGQVSKALTSIRPLPSPPVMLTSPSTRPILRDLLDGVLPNLVVLSHSEVPRGMKVRAVGSVG